MGWKVRMLWAGCSLVGTALWSVISQGNTLTKVSIDDSSSLSSWSSLLRVPDQTVPDGFRDHTLFVPHPHRSIGEGTTQACSWKTLQSMTQDELNSLVGRHHLDGRTGLDIVQTRALMEGVCLPLQDSAREKLHLFSTQEAKSCLRDKYMLFAGDSYTRELLVGLTDVLLGKPSRVSPADAEQRNSVFWAASEFLEMEHESDPTFPDIRWVCQPCEAKTADFSKECAECIDSQTKELYDPITVVGSGLKLYNTLGNDKKATKEALKQFALSLKSPILFSSMPSLESFEDPRSPMRNLRDKEALFWRSELILHKAEVPFLDVYHATRSCATANCTADGAHKARYVNRWKAQLLLNKLCSYYNDQDEKASDEPEQPVVTDETLRKIQRGQPSATPKTNKADVVATTTEIPQARFVPFPHRPIGVGKDASCRWMARDAHDGNDEIVQQLLSPSDKGLVSPDYIQETMLHDSVCVPESDEEANKLHLFSTDEAKKCLEDVSIVVAGDSYARNLYIGLSEILLGEVSNEEILSGTDRKHVLTQYNDTMQERRATDPSMPEIIAMCTVECYGSEPNFRATCSKCMQDFIDSRPSKTVVPVVGAGIHIYNLQYNRDINETLVELRAFFKRLPGMVYASQPCYDISKVPEQYRKSTFGRELMYWKMLPRLHQFDVAYLDYYQPTHTCWMDNCTADGGHRSRFVNRWKAQLLLNKICEIS